MNNPFVPQVGGILSADIAVPEHEREKLFYSRVLGTGEKPLWREDLMNNAGMPIIGLGARTAELDHLPLQWMPHIQVADVSASVDRALELGGSELMHGKDAEGSSQWAVLLDPNGAAFGIIPVVSEAAISRPDDTVLPDAVGRITWISLTVSDSMATCDFYRHVIGWEVREFQMEDDDGSYANYDLIDGGGNPAARICQARGADLPPIWLIFLPVDDLAESLRRVQEGGGKIVKSRWNERGYEVAVVQDPVGAFLALAHQKVLLDRRG